VRDVAQLDLPSRGGGSGELIDLRRGLRAAGRQALAAGCQDASEGGTEAVLLPGGSFATAPFRAVRGTCGPDYVAGALTLDGATGAKVAAPSARALAPSRGLDGRGSGVYYLDASGQAARVDGSGIASEVPWAKARSLAWHARSFPIRLGRVATSFLGANGAASFAVRSTHSPSRETTTLELTVDTRPRDTAPAPDRRTFSVAKLAPNSAKDVRVIASRGSDVLVAGRFADAPSRLRLRLYRPNDSGTRAPRLDLPISDVLDAANKAVVTDSADVALAHAQEIAWWSINAETGDYQLAHVPAANAGDLSAVGRQLYFTDEAGVHVLRPGARGSISVD
jgi:hypothetical protein